MIISMVLVVSGFAGIGLGLLNIMAMMNTPIPGSPIAAIVLGLGGLFSVVTGVITWVFGF